MFHVKPLLLRCVDSGDCARDALTEPQQDYDSDSSLRVQLVRDFGLSAFDFRLLRMVHPRFRR